LSHFEISVKCELFEENNICFLVNFSLFWTPKNHHRARRQENKETRFCYFVLGIRLPIQIQLLDIENTKKIESS
jgi:hypothetical protein